MAKKEQKTKEQYLQEFLHSQNILSITELQFIDNYTGKRNTETGSIRYAGYHPFPLYLTFSNEECIPVKMRVNYIEEELRSSYYGFLRFNPLRLDCVYAEYDTAKRAWTNLEKLEHDGIGIFVGVELEVIE